jgi:hypothetical protein
MSRNEYLRAVKPWALSYLPWKRICVAISRLTLVGLSILLLAGCNIIKPTKDGRTTPTVQPGNSSDESHELAAEVKAPERISPPIAAVPAPRPEPVIETKAATASVIAIKQQPHRTSLVVSGVRSSASPGTNVQAEPPPVSTLTVPKQSIAEKPGSIVISGPQTVYPTRIRKARLSQVSGFVWLVVSILLLGVTAFAVRPVRTRLKDVSAQISSRLRRLRKRDEDGFEDGKLMLARPNRSAAKKAKVGDSIEDTVLEA